MSNENNWIPATIGDLAQYINGRAFKPTEWKSEGKPIIRIQNLNKHSAPYNCSPLEYDDKYLVEFGDLLFAWSASLGAYIWHGSDAWLNQHIFKVVPFTGIDKGYVYYLLQYITSQLYAKSHGSGMVHITKGKFEATKTLLPPTNEQHRIVSKVEELFSEIDKGVESLKTAKAQLQVYRQALLKHAFEGKLTEQWRKDNPDKVTPATELLEQIKQAREQRYQQQLSEWEVNGRQGNKPKALKIFPPLPLEKLAELPKLPEEWSWVRPEEICFPEPYSIGIGPFGSNLKVSDYRDSGVPLVFVKNITRSDFSLNLKFIDNIKYNELIPHSVKPLDLLITKMGDPPGDCEIYPENAPIAVLTADCLKFRVWDKFADRKIYKFCINSNIVKRQLRLITKGVAQKKISVERFKTICLPIFSIEEQKLLAQKLESRLSIADQLDQIITTALQQTNTLKQSILKKAFSGQLVEQDPNDEPASELLERIKAEKLALEAVAKLAKAATKKRKAKTA